MINIKISYYPHYYQELIHDSQARFRVICAGRRFGKSLCACAESFKFAVSKPKQRIWNVSPTFKLSSESERILKDIIPTIAIKEIRKADRTIVFGNESEIEFKSAENEVSLRGSGLDFLVLDEASRIKESSWLAVRPALADRKGKALFISTPNGKNYFYYLYLKGKNPDFKDYESWRFSSVKNPYFDKIEYNELKKSLPQDFFSQEIEAEFIDNASRVFRNIPDRIKGSLESPKTDEEKTDEKTNEKYYMGVDLAKHQDFTCIIVLNSKKHVVFYDRFQKLDWKIQKKKIINVSRKYNNASILLDSTGVGDPIEEDLKRVNEDSYITGNNYINIQGFKFTNTSKQQLISNLQLAFETGGITFPKIPTLIDELEAYEYQILASGKFKYGAPAGLHDDTVTSLALGNWSVDHMNYETGFSKVLDWSFR